MENNMKVTQIAECLITIRFSDSPSGYILSNVENKDPKRDLYSQVYSSIIYSSQKLEAFPLGWTGLISLLSKGLSSVH